MINNEHENIKANFGNGFISETRIIGTTTCRDDRKENIILDTSTEIFEYIATTGLLIIDKEV